MKIKSDLIWNKNTNPFHDLKNNNNNNNNRITAIQM